MIWWILISFMLVLLLWLLLAPVIIFASTDRNRYSLSLPGVFQAALVPSHDLFLIKGWIFFVPYTFNPFRSRKKKSKSEKTKKKKKAIWRRSPVRSGMIKRVFRAIRIKKLRLNLDTDDFVLNAWLIPAFSYINSGNVQMSVNFQGDFSLHLDVRTRIGALLWAFIRNKL